MRKLILSMGVSLDGLVARPAGVRAAGWGLPPDDPALKRRKLGWFDTVDLHLMGRVTYEEMSQFWPTSDDPYAAPMNEIPKVVFSRTLQHADWAQTRIAGGELETEITALKQRDGGELLAWGGSGLAQSLSSLGLVDEYRLILQPVVLGEGLPLFSGVTQPLHLELIDAQVYGTGAALHTYRPAASPT